MIYSQNKGMMARQPQQPQPLPTLPWPVMLLLRLNSIGVCTFWASTLGIGGAKSLAGKACNGTKTVLRFGSSLDNMRLGRYYTLLTSQFLHVEPLHFAGNMMALCRIGTVVHEIAGTRRFCLCVPAAAAFSSICGLAYQRLLLSCGRRLRERKSPTAEKKAKRSPWLWAGGTMETSEREVAKRMFEFNKRKYDAVAVDRLIQSGSRSKKKLTL